MARLTAEKRVEEEVAASVDQAWALLSDFRSITRRAQGIQDFTLEGEGTGAIRSFRIDNGPLMRERIEAFDAAQHFFAYSLLPPAFMDDHYSEVRMRALGPQRCAITWMGRCSVTSAEDAAAREAMFEATFRNGIAWVRRELGIL